MTVKFQIKLFRSSTPDGLPSFDEKDCVEEPELSRIDYGHTVNDLKVQYAKRLWDTKARITQEVIETLRHGNPFARISQDVIEYIHHGVPYARITQNVIEVLGEYSISSSSSSVSSSSSSSSSSSWSSSSSSSSSRSSSSSSSSSLSSSSSSSSVSSSSSSLSSSSSSSESSSSSSRSSSSSSNSSSSSSSYSMATSEWVWGHDTGVTEAGVADFSEGSGTALVGLSGDAEYLCIESGEYFILPAKNTGAVEVEITYDEYDTGLGTGTIEYRTGATGAECEAASWNTYSAHFASLGWVQIRISVS